MSGKLTDEFNLPCLLKPREDATAISMAENLMREAMHPADEFMAFNALKAQRKSEKEIAKRFGVSSAYVKKMLRLSSVSPELISAFRNQDLDLDQIMAFTISTDHKAQMDCWRHLKSSASPYQIRQRLLNNAVNVSDARVKFVTLASYKAAGGQIATDLFQEKEYVLHEELLDKLVEEKLSLAVTEIQAQGWDWVSVETRPYSMKRLKPIANNASSELLAELETAKVALEKLEEKDWTEDYEDAFEQLDNTVIRLTNAIEGCDEFTPQQMASAGCFISFSEEGDLLVARGYSNSSVTNESSLFDQAGTDTGSDSDSECDDDDSESESPPPAPTLDYSQAHLLDLGTYYRLSLQAAMARQEDLARDLLIFTLADNVLGVKKHWDIALDLSITNSELVGVDLQQTNAFKVLETAKNALDLSWQGDEDSSERFALFSALSIDKKNAIQTYCVAQLLRGSPAKSSRQNFSFFPSVRKRLNFDMRKYWQPTAANYFSRIDKKSLAEIGKELAGEEFAKANANAKKAVLAEHIEVLPQVEGWLPDIFS